MKNPPESLVDLFLDSNINETTIIFGAGVSLSMPVGLPTVSQFTTKIMNALGASPNQVEQAIDKLYGAKYPPRFELLIEEIKNNFDKELNLAELFSSEHFNENHKLISHLISLGADAVTTNFDKCVENSSESRATAPIVFTGVDLDDLPKNAALIKPHGSIGRSNHDLVISISALAQTNKGFVNFPRWRQLLLDKFSKKLLIVMGYSGSDDFDINPLLKGSSPNLVAWLQHESTNSMPLARRKNTRADKRILEKFRNLNVHIYRGNTSLFAKKLLELFGTDFFGADESVSEDRFAKYVGSVCKNENDRAAFLNTVFLHYGLYGEVVKSTEIGESDLLDYQINRALFSLNNYKEIVKNIENSGIRWEKPTYQQNYYYASALSYLGRFNESKNVIAKLIRLLQESEELSENLLLISSLNHLGAIYFMQDNTQESETTYLEALEHNKDISIENYATSIWGLGDICLTRADHKSAIGYYKEAEEAYKNLGGDRARAFMLLNIGEALLLIPNHRKAYKYFLRSLKIFKAIGYQVGVLNSYNGLLKVNLLLGNKNKAEHLLMKAYKLLEQLPNSPPAVITYSLHMLHLLLSEENNQRVHLAMSKVERNLINIEQSEARIDLIKTIDLAKKDLTQRDFLIAILKDSLALS